MSKRKINKGLIVLSKGERLSVISLLGLIVILLGFSVFRPMMVPKKGNMAFHKLDSLIAVQEASKVVIPTNETPKSMETNRQEHVREYKPSSKEKRPPKKEADPKPLAPTKPAKVVAPIDINQADSTALVALPQIGEVMASRIHRYRNRLGGFVSMDQLYEIKGMDNERFETIKPYIILDDNNLTRINVNHDEFKTLLRHPYLEYEQVKAIVNHRERKGLIKNWEQLMEIVSDVNPLLEYYITY